MTASRCGVIHETKASTMREGQAREQGSCPGGSTPNGSHSAGDPGVPLREAQQRNLAPDQQATMTMPIVGRLALPLLSLQDQPSDCGALCLCGTLGQHGMHWSAGDPVLPLSGEERRWIAEDSLAERTADAMDQGER